MNRFEMEEIVLTDFKERLRQNQLFHDIGFLISGSVFSRGKYKYFAYMIDKKQIEISIGKYDEHEIEEYVLLGKEYQEYVKKYDLVLSNKNIFYVLCDFVNHFKHGNVLVGTNSLNSYLNSQHRQIHESCFGTQDIDVYLENVNESCVDIHLSSILNENMISKNLIKYFGVPSFDLLDGFASFKAKNNIRIDFLSGNQIDGDEKINITPKNKIGTRSQTIPYVKFLTKNAHHDLLFSNKGVVQVNVPDINRYVIHKAYSCVNRNEKEKAAKDRQQIDLLIDLIMENDFHQLVNTYKTAPKKLQKAFLDVVDIPILKNELSKTQRKPSY